MEHAQEKRIGQVLKDRRNQLGYTQEFAAEKVGISYSYYTKIERGEQLPSLDVCLLIAQAFHLSLDQWLLGASVSNASPEMTDLLDCLSKLSHSSVDDIQQLLQKVSLFIK